MADIQNACKISKANGKMVQMDPGDYPAFCTMCTGSFSGVNRPGRGADYPPHLSSEVMKG
jgi:hypothetical protein